VNSPSDRISFEEDIMLAIHRNLRAWALVLCGSITAAGVAIYPSRSHADAPGTAAANIDQLKQQRVAVLREASDQTSKLFLQGTARFDDVDRLNELLLGAELDAAATPEQRMAVLQKAETLATSQATDAAARADAGLVTQAVVLEAKAHLLEVQIKLAEESAK